MFTQEVEFQNNEISIKATKKPNCQVELNVTVTPKATVAAYHEALRNVRKEISLPGFRKGKAPDAMVLANYSPQVEKEWQHILINSALTESVKLSQIYPLNRNVEGAKLLNHSKEEGANLHFHYESRPDVPEISLEGIKLDDVAPKAVTEEQIKNVLESIRHQQATWTEEVGRPIEENDHVVLDIQKLDGNKEMLCVDQNFEMTQGKMGEWMRKLLLGKNVGDKIEGTSEKAPEQPQNAPFEPTHCLITIKKIQKGSFPSDETLVSKTGAKSLEDLRASVKTRLEHQATLAAREEKKNQLINILLKKYQFELPTSLVVEETRFRMKNKLQALRAQNLSDDLIKSRQKEIENEVAHQVDKQLRLFFLLKGVSEKNKFQVSQNELTQEFARQLMQVAPEDSLIDTQMDPQEMRTRLYLAILTEKAKDYLIDQL